MNDLTEEEMDNLVADVVALIICILAISTFFIVYTAGAYVEEPYENPVCRDEFGHRMDCDER